jgi:hypothetical protein
MNRLPRSLEAEPLAVEAAASGIETDLGCISFVSTA